MVSKKENGAVLFFALIFALIITGLVLAALQTGILANKMSGVFSSSNLALVMAEKKLTLAEHKLAKGTVPKEAVLISNAICGVDFYLVTAKGTISTISKTVQSTYAKVGDISRCKPKPVIAEGRQSWRVWLP